MRYRQCKRGRVGFSMQVSELPPLHGFNFSVFISVCKL